MRFLHITDTHLSSVENNNTFEKIIDYINLNNKKLNIDQIIVTGDISDDGSTESYQKFFREIKKLNLSYNILHGNHDNYIKMMEISSKNGVDIGFEFITRNGWVIVSLDTVVEGEDYGSVSKNELEKLIEKINKYKNYKIALFMHHHIFAVGTPIVDACKLVNSGELLQSINGSSIKFIGTGHAHTLFQRRENGILISVAPAVCSQWINGTISPAKISNSGFNIISLDDDTHIETWLLD